MAINRSKAASGNIWNVVHDWYCDREVPYVAHAYLANGNIIQLRAPLSCAASTRSNNHPDQLYWRSFDGGLHQIAVRGIGQSIAAAGGVANIRSIDIDCKLTTCCDSDQSCLYAVPSYMRNYYQLNNIALRIFSHADENMGGAGTSKRVIQCVTSDNATALLAAYNYHDGWSWVP
jgi:hypothetical protein